MLRTLFIRHGKAASLLSANYDALSPMGVEQSERIGAWLAAQGILPDAVFIGPRKRHAESYAASARASASRGCSLPAPAVVPDLDEHDAVKLVGQLLPALAADDVGIAALVAAVASGRSPPEEDILTAFHGVARRWVAGELPAGNVETWAAFRARVGRALEAVTHASAAAARDRSGTVLVFTSAGVIAAAVGLALGLADAKTVDLSVAPYNGSVTEMIWGPSGWALRSFNATPFESRLLTRI